MSGPDAADRTAELLASQMEYYDLHAPDFGDESKPDRRVPGFGSQELVRSVIDEIVPRGDVLEIACGPGAFTRELSRTADLVTALDSSPAMLDRNRESVSSARVTYVAADIFGWEPDRPYDLVFFANWLSHVPPAMFEPFWTLLRRCLKPGGRVAFFDEDDRASDYDATDVIDGTPVARRLLNNGREFDIVKVFWEPPVLEGRIRALGWDVTVRRIGDSFLFGEGRAAGRAR